MKYGLSENVILLLCIFKIQYDIAKIVMSPFSKYTSQTRKTKEKGS